MKITFGYTSRKNGRYYIKNFDVAKNYLTGEIILAWYRKNQANMEYLKLLKNGNEYHICDEGKLINLLTNY